MRPSRSTWRR
ncbi:hypothetical protein FFLO_03915 [Filobasidium floriforme]|uniref:Uncharacterized protein n=1 Tax=Filobasidium floriforme TaxID=5210 RepID=A0A8K0NMU0_9TREE|nr:hypothetical protein FFLO_03915 [Filobasidium floriforme]